MILNKRELIENIKNGKIIVKNENFEDINVNNIKINPNSIDVKLHSIFKTYYPFLKIELENYTVLLDKNSVYHLIMNTVIEENKKNNNNNSYLDLTFLLKFEDEDFQNIKKLKKFNDEIEEKIKKIGIKKFTKVFEENKNKYIKNVIEEYQYKCIIDTKKKQEVYNYKVNENKGLLLFPGVLYLGVTKECIGSKYFVPMYEGRSSTGRVGISSHVTAGFGDIGYIGYWTLEIWTLQPTIVYPGMHIGQVYFYKTDFDKNDKNLLYSGKYSKQLKPVPIESKIYKDFNKKQQNKQSK